MDINTVIQLINGVGFPIAACIGMGGFIVWDKKTRMEDRARNEEKQEEMLKKLKESVDNNTQAVEQLVKRLEGQE